MSYCPKKLRRRLSSESGAREEEDDPRIPTPMVGHLINRMMLERAGEEQVRKHLDENCDDQVMTYYGFKPLTDDCC